MKSWLKGVSLALLHLVIVLGLGAKLLRDRSTLPRVWARTATVDPDSPLRGRYLTLQLEVDGRRLPSSSNCWQSVKLVVEDSRLTGLPVERGSGSAILGSKNPQGVIVWLLQDRIDFYIPEHAPDPSHRAAGEELWVEVTIPEYGPPRPIRLGVMKEGKLAPLELN